MEEDKKLCKKIRSKEHAIEDVEGYQDHYEERYKEIGSAFEPKWSDRVCEEGRLENEPKFQGARKLSEVFKSSRDVLNLAHAETLPRADALDGRTPKKKTVKDDVQFTLNMSTPTPLSPFDYKTSGVMAYKRRHIGPFLNSYQEMVPDMHERKTHTYPAVTSYEASATGSSSSSSYCSFPLKYGIPNAAESIKWDVCVAEMKEGFIKDVPHEYTPTFPSFTENSDKSTISTQNIPLSQSVQEASKKDLKAKSFDSNKDTTKVINDSVLPSKADHISPSFGKEVICKSKAALFVDQQKSKEFAPTQAKENALEEIVPKILCNEKIGKVNDIIDLGETSSTKDQIQQDKSRNKVSECDVYNEIKNYEISMSPVEYSDYDLETKRIQAIRQVLSRRISFFNPKNTQSKNLKVEEPESSAMLKQISMGVKPHVYHQLSTIQEVDSAITTSCLSFSHSRLCDTSVIKAQKEPTSPEKSENLAKFGESLKMASSLDPPDSGIAELTKSICIDEMQNIKDNLLEIPNSVTPECLTIMPPSSKDYLSTPSHVTDVEIPKIKAVETPDVINSNNFHCMILHSDILCPNVHVSDTDVPVHVSDFGENLKRVVPTKNTVLKENHGSSVQCFSFENNGDVKSVTPHYNIASPNEFAVHITGIKHHDVASNAESIKALTSHSNISSTFAPSKLQTYNSNSKALTRTSGMKTPVFPYQFVYEEPSLCRRLFNSEFPAMTIGFNISPSSVSPNKGSQLNELKKSHCIIYGDNKFEEKSTANSEVAVISNGSEALKKLTELKNSHVVPVDPEQILSHLNHWEEETKSKKSNEFIKNQEEQLVTDEDLTLMSFTLNSKIDSGKKEDPSTSRLVNYFANKGVDIVVTTSERECKTVSFQSPHPATTPSLLSFLQHEISCMHVADSTGPSSECMNKVSNVPECKKPQQQITKGATTECETKVSKIPIPIRRKMQQKAQKEVPMNPKSVYKQRTKRLWNNLPEVKEKNLIEEKRREREINRLKAKEYAKKFTKKGKK